MMRGKVLVGILGLMAGFMLSVTEAQAGAGGSPSPLTSFFLCQGITGDVAGQVVDIEVPLFGLNLKNIKIGNGVLACAFAKLFAAGTTTEIDPNPGNVGIPENLKCYAISAKRQDALPLGAPTAYNIVTALSEETGVLTTGTRYLCAPGSFIRAD